MNSETDEFLFQAARDVIYVVHISLEDFQVHHLEKLQMEVVDSSAYHLLYFTCLAFHLCIPCKYQIFLYKKCFSTISM